MNVKNITNKQNKKIFRYMMTMSYHIHIHTLTLTEKVWFLIICKNNLIIVSGRSQSWVRRVNMSQLDKHQDITVFDLSIFNLTTSKCPKPKSFISFKRFTIKAHLSPLTLSSELLSLIESLLWHEGRLWLVVGIGWLFLQF